MYIYILVHAWCYEFHFPADVVLAQCVIFSFSFLGFISISLKKKKKKVKAEICNPKLFVLPLPSKVI